MFETQAPESSVYRHIYLVQNKRLIEAELRALTLRLPSKQTANSDPIESIFDFHASYAVFADFLQYCHYYSSGTCFQRTGGGVQLAVHSPTLNHSSARNPAGKPTPHACAEDSFGVRTNIMAICDTAITFMDQIYRWPVAAAVSDSPRRQSIMTRSLHSLGIVKTSRQNRDELVINGKIPTAFANLSAVA
jgi:hypothetical protein